MEAFFGWYSANRYEEFMILQPHDRSVLAVLLDADLLQHHHAADAVVQARADDAVALFCVAMVVNVGMWLERFVIVVTSLHRDFLPSSWGMYYPTLWDWMTFFGTIGLFLMLFFLFIRVLPMISIFEMRTHGAGRRRCRERTRLSAVEP